jgi:hypothetical protein
MQLRIGNRQMSPAPPLGAHSDAGFSKVRCLIEISRQ